jgi:hypothetical protein
MIIKFLISYFLCSFKLCNNAVTNFADIDRDTRLYDNVMIIHSSKSWIGEEEFSIWLKILHPIVNVE